MVAPVCIFNNIVHFMEVIVHETATFFLNDSCLLEHSWLAFFGESTKIPLFDFFRKVFAFKWVRWRHVYYRSEKRCWEITGQYDHLITSIIMKKFCKNKLYICIEKHKYFGGVFLSDKIFYSSKIVYVIKWL